MLHDNEMLSLCIIGVLFGVAASVPTEDCVTSRWTGWSECQSTRRCFPEDEKKDLLKTYQMEATDAWDTGRAKMKYIMMMKEKRRLELEACIADGTCPSSMADRPSSGPIACGADGLAADLECSNVDQLYFLNFADQGYVPVASDSNPAGNDVWGWTDPMNGDEYAIVGLRGGTTFIRVTDPINPVPVGVLYTATTASTWRDMKVIGNYAYIVSEASNHGLQVFDLTRLRGKTSVETFTPDATHNGFGNAHNIAANEDTNFLYVIGATQSGYPQTCRGGLYVIDVSEPLNPTYVGCFGDDGYVHDTQCVIYHGPDTRFTGHEICFCFNENSFTLVDVTDKNNMYMITKSGYNGVAYTHQGWITEDHTIVLLDDELDEQNAAAGQRFTMTYIWDVTDLHLPTLKNVYSASVQSIDHNQYIVGDLVYQSNYESGLRILHIDQETYTLTQVGYFDCYPPGTTANFNGSWSVYPYFESGTILLNSIDYGIFILRPNKAAIRELIESKTVPAERTRSRELLYRAGNAVCPALEQAEQCVAAPAC